MTARLFVTATMLVIASSGMAAKKGPTKEEIRDADLRKREHMVEISRQIGVTCTYCHDVKDFKKANKSAYKISKTHIEMVNLLNEKYTNKVGEKVDCYMCHRGQPKWDYREKKPVGH